MPGFRLSEAEIRALVGFSGELKDGAAPPLAEQRRFQGTISVANVQAGRRLASREFLSCSSCHVGEEQPEGNPDEWAPDLRVAGRRLSPDWIVRWLQDPQRVSPGTKMPSFFADETSGPEDILDGDEERQMLALRDYILSLGGAGSPETGHPAAPAK
jgi:mono/diheme cytochrome c family protein